MWVFGQKKKPNGERLDEPVGSFVTAALRCNVMPDVVEIGIGLRCAAMGLQRGGFCSAASRARPRCLTLSESSRIDS